MSNLLYYYYYYYNYYYISFFFLKLFVVQSSSLSFAEKIIDFDSMFSLWHFESREISASEEDWR